MINNTVERMNNYTESGIPGMKFKKLDQKYIKQALYLKLY